MRLHMHQVNKMPVNLEKNKSSAEEKADRKWLE